MCFAERNQPKNILFTIFFFWQEIEANKNIMLEMT